MVLTATVSAFALEALLSPETPMQVRECAGADVGPEEVPRTAMERVGMGGETEEFERRPSRETGGAEELLAGYSDASPETAGELAEAGATVFGVVLNGGP